VAIGAHGLGELAPLPAGEVLGIAGFALAVSLANDFAKVALIARLAGGEARPLAA
jgi:hypothetical protein